MLNEEYTLLSEESPWDYFPNDDKKAKRFLIKIKNTNVMHVDYFINEENCYLLSIYVYPEYRNQNMPIIGSRLMYEYLSDNELKNVKTLVYPNMDESTKTIYKFDKRRYAKNFNMASIDTSIKRVYEINEKQNDL